MTEIRSVKEEIKVSKIISEALEEALFGVTPKSYREIWSDMLGKILDLQNPGFITHWKKAEPEYQDEMGRLVELPCNEFLRDIARIENSVYSALALEGKQQTLN